MSKSIAIVVSTFPPYHAGMGNVAAAQAKMLSLQGFDVTVFAPGEVAPQDKEWPFTVKRVKPILQYGNAALLPNLQPWLKDFSTIIFHYPYFGASERLVGALRADQELLVYYHMDAIGRGAWRLIFGIHRNIFLGGLIKRADKILVSSSSYGRASFLTKFLRGASHKIVELPIAIDVDRFTPGPKSAELLVKHGFSYDNKVCLFVGALDSAHYFKGLDNLLAAWQRVLPQQPLAKLLIIGQGNLEIQYRQRAAALNINESVIFLGRIESALLPEYYRLSDLLILPSIDRSEAFGLVILEAMASGRAVIASSLPGVSSLVRPDETGYLIEPGDIQEIVTTINLLFNNDTQREGFGLAARQVAVQNYSEEVIAKKLVKLVSN